MGAIIFKQNKYGGNTDVTDGNHVIVDNGSGSNVTVQQMYNNILNNIATVETTSTASKNYAVDEHLIYNGLLYKVTVTIAQGDILVVGTNITRVNITDWLSDSGDGSIVSFDDGADGIPVRDLKVQMEPIQDLHGYDNPWPAGGGKNKLPMNLADIKIINTSGTWNNNVYVHNGVTYTLTEFDGYVTQVSVNGTATGGNSFLNVNKKTVLADGTYILSGCPTGGSGDAYFLRSMRGINVFDRGSGSSEVTYDSGSALYVYININDGVSVSNIVFKPMIRLASESDATFAPYSNICPISGRDSVTVTRTGFNAWDEEWEVANIKTIIQQHYPQTHTM